MPDPISSRVDDARLRSSGGDDDLTCHDDDAAPRATSTIDPTSASSDSAPAAQTEPGVRGPLAEAHARADDLYAGAFALRGRDANGIDVEVFSAQAHWNDREAVAQAGMGRVGGSMFGDHVQASAEVFTAQVHSTIDNPDGSAGIGASIGATAVGGEITLSGWGFSVTGGASIGTTFGASIGLRDSDADGDPELCGRVDFGVGSLGACLEKVW